MKHVFGLISGPTGVGKTELVDKLSQRIKKSSGYSIEIINGDMGQMYQPLSIGTAKPHWQTAKVPHHLFDIIDKPCNFTVQNYRDRLLQTLEAVWLRGALPLVVGGSGFYVKSLFFPPFAPACLSVDKELANSSIDELWHELNAVDPARARVINPQDTYRLTRALTIWHQTGQKPSSFMPTYQPPGCFMMIFLNRERADLYNRIDKRVQEMMQQGWLDEVKSLDKEWLMFLDKKKLIGYPEINSFLMSSKDYVNKAELIREISRNTRHYAKRQITFWRSLHEQLVKADEKKEFLKDIHEVNLTLLNLTLYIDQLAEKLITFTL